MLPEASVSWRLLGETGGGKVRGQAWIGALLEKHIERNSAAPLAVRPT
jgi:hypothetical protein